MKVKCTKNILSPINALSFKMTGGTRSIKEHTQEDEIIALECSDDEVIALGDVVKVKDRDYKVNIIEKEEHKGVIIYRLSTDKRTKASMFVLPLFRGNRNLYFWNRLFLNCFIKTKENKYCIALLYRWSADPLFLKFEKAVSKFRDFKKVYDPTDNTIMFVFNIPKDLQKDFKYFIKGKYSKLSPQYKIDILRFHNQAVDSEIGQVLYKDPDRKYEMEEKLGVIFEDDTELLSIINIENETFKIENYV